MGKKAHYPAEIKWKVVEMKHQGFKNKEIMDALGIRHVAQIKTWMKWYREGETYRKTIYTWKRLKKVNRT
ncbi:hypothetical protein [Bacillus luti]|uniref:hypothetical protein n=1 Tax=Bacillus luti TaxID=2026191 RepID=UPI003CFC33E1